jgi:hypothetical protein
MFLRNYFTIPAEAVENNEIFKNGYAEVDKELFKGKSNTYQIIPIFKPAPAEHYFPIPVFSSGTNWPVINEKQVQRYKGKVKKRVQAFFMNAAELKGINKLLLWIGTRILLNRQVTKFVMNKITGALKDHHLIK